MTGIDIVDFLWVQLNVPSVTSLLGSGKVWKHNRPKNSPYVDVVISVPEYNSTETNSGYVDVNVHSPNLDNYYPIPGGTEDNTFPDLAVLRNVTDAIMPLIVSSGDYSLEARIPGIPIRDTDGHWYSNIRIAFTAINPELSEQVTLEDEVITPDGYGGNTITYVSHWTGLAAQQNFSTTRQDSIQAGELVLHLESDWVVPVSATPQKGMRINADNGIYVINGITPEGDAFWRLKTTRRDGDY